MTALSGRLSLPEPREAEPALRWRAVRSGPFGVLDIGSTKVVALIGRVSGGETVSVLGLGWKRAQGVKAGAIVDLDAADKVIRSAVGEAENKAEHHLEHVTVTLACGSPESRLFNLQWPIGGRAVTPGDIHRLIEEGTRRAATEGRHIVHTLPLGFSLDETEGVIDPSGLCCETLGLKLHVIDVASSALRNLRQTLARADLALEAAVVAPLAAGLGVLTPDERELGATVVDMGGGITAIGIFIEGQIIHATQIPIGGQHVTNDIARLLSTSLDTAERLKTLYGNVEASPDDEREMLPVTVSGDDEPFAFERVPRRHLIEIIRPRLEETLELIKDRLDASGLTRDGASRVVLTGGACQLPGLRELAARILGRPVRLGRPMPLPGVPEENQGPGLAVAAGLLLWASGLDGGAGRLGREEFGRRRGGLIRRLVGALRERFA
jgi:cell division protein FtsA